MTAFRLSAGRRATYGPEDGFTLLEVIMSVVLLTMIGGAMSAAFVTSMNSSGGTKARVQASDDAQNIAAFLIRDAQAAGGVDPTNPTLAGDQALGVSLTDAAGCAAPAGLVFRFAWRDFVTAAVSHVHVATYYVTAKQLVRATCIDSGAPSTLTLGRDITSTSPSCKPATACPGIPDSVSLTVTETTSDTAAALPAYTYTLQATVRPQGQNPPSGGTPVGFPTLLALGGCTPASNNTPGVAGSGGATLTVNGPSIINGSDATGCTLVSQQGGANFNTTPPYVELPAGLPDPYASLPTPNKQNGQQFNEQNDCPASGGTNPAPGSGGNFVPGVYQLPVSITNTVTFNPGTYFFCHAPSLSGHANVTANGVLWYFAQGALSISGANTTLVMSGITSGPDAGLVIWMPRTNATTAATFNGNTTIGQTTGTIYAPNVDVTINGSAAVEIGSIIARTIIFNGGSGSHVGPYTPTVGAPNPASGPVGTSVSISGSGFRSASSLTITVGGTTATITSGASTDAIGNVAATFTIPNLASGTYPIAVSDGSNTATSATSFVVSPPPKFVFTSAALSGAATASPTLGPIAVQYQTAGGAPITTGVTVTLSSDSTGTAKFAATSGGTAVASISIPPGSSTANFFYADTKAGSPKITASATGVTSATQQEIITGAAPASLLLANCKINAGTTSCTTSPFKLGNNGNFTANVQVQDAFGNAATIAGSISLSVSSGDTTNFQVSSGSSLTIDGTANPPNQSTAIFTVHHGSSNSSTTITVHVTGGASGVTDMTFVVSK